MWNKEDMDHYSSQLELQETLVLCAIYDEGMVDIKRVVSFVMNHTKEYDVNYIHSVFNLLLNNNRPVHLDLLGE